MGRLQVDVEKVYLKVQVEAEVDHVLLVVMKKVAVVQKEVHLTLHIFSENLLLR